jgi:8-oxo-dGTP diphosphatase
MTAYPPFAVTVDLVAMMIRNEELSVLLVKRAAEPFKGSWALPGGFVQRGPVKVSESLDEAAAREFREETGLALEAAYVTQLGAYGDPDRDPRGNVVTVAYLAIAPAVHLARAGGDAAEARWFAATRVLEGSPGLAFDHRQIIADAVERTRELIETTALALSFCDPWFTVPSLRRVYEIVWDLPRETLDPGSFHKRLTGMPGLIQAVSDGDLDPRRGDASHRALPAEAPPPDDVRPASVGTTSRGRPPQLYEAGPLVREAGPAARLERLIERPWQSGPDDITAPARPMVNAGELMHGDIAAEFASGSPSVGSVALETTMHQARRIIWQRGRTGSDVHYGELADLLGIHRRSAAFFELLDALCIEEARVGGPMITALVVNKRTRMPGQRFFALAKSLGRDVLNLREFAAGERQRVVEWIRAHPERARLDDESDVEPAASSSKNMTRERLLASAGEAAPLIEALLALEGEQGVRLIPTPKSLSLWAADAHAELVPMLYVYAAGVHFSPDCPCLYVDGKELRERGNEGLLDAVRKRLSGDGSWRLMRVDAQCTLDRTFSKSEIATVVGFTRWLRDQITGRGA